MRALLTAALSLALGVGVLASPALGSSVPTLGAGDLGVVSASGLVCAVGKTKSAAAVDCFKLGAKGAAPNSYSVGLAGDGTTVLQHVDAKGNVTIVRKLQRHGRAAKTIKLAAGDRFLVAGTDIGCVVVGEAVTCFRYDSKGTVPNSYGFVLTSTYAAIVKYDAAGKPHTVVMKAHA